MASAPHSLAGSSNQRRDRTLPTPVTYRHLLSNGSLNPSNPLRVIALCDIDAAYAQFEMVRLGLDKNIPCAVQQWSGLIAINYPARVFGISRHESADEARKKCPDIVCVHVATYREGDDEPGYHADAKHETHKVSLEPYRVESRKILKIFAEMCPTIQKASIDEAYLDFTIPVRQIMLERYPQLATVPEGSPLGLDTPVPLPPSKFDFEGLGHLVPIVSPEEEPDLKGKGKAVEVQEEVTWSDIAIAIGAELMQKCREAVKERLGYTCSAGIAKNKSLAKLCAGYNKPDAQTVLRPSAVAGFLRPLQFQKIRNLGGKLGAAIAAEYDAATVGDLWTVSLDEMQQKYGEEPGLWVWEIIRGIDFGEVENKTNVKSMVSSKNFKPAISKWDEATHWLKIMSAELCHRLNEARELSSGLWPKTLALHHRSDNYVTKNRQAPFPYTSNLTPGYILKLGDKLLRDFIAERKGPAQSELGLCTNLSLQFQNLERQESGQRGIEGFFGAGNSKTNGTPPKNAKRKAGSQPASPQILIDGSLVAAIRVKKVKTDADAIEDEPTKQKQTSKVKFTCDKCQKTLKSTITCEPPSDLKLLKADALARLKAEHLDYHFARDLMADQKVIVGGQPRKKPDAVAKPSKSNAAKNAKKTSSGSGLANFFAKK